MLTSNNMISFINTFLLSGLVALSTISCSQNQEPASGPDANYQGKPNIVIIFFDDAGWADFKPFHETRYPTPNIEQLAVEGCRFQNFYVPQAICSASRATLMTGCYPGRTKVFGAFAPKVRGLEPRFATMGEVLKTSGYKTAIFGKWHLGDQEETRPHNRGFDESCGLMYSNDMWSEHPTNPEFWGQFPLHYWENGEITIDSVTAEDQVHLTTWYTEKAVEFINTNPDTSFFLYVPHSMPHVPIFASDKFKGKSGTGLYGDVMMELDWSVGQITNALKQNGLDENTLVILTSDNGPWHSYGNRAGKTPYREAKGTSFDGGIRSPCIIKYPGQIEPNSVSLNTFYAIDILPTLCQLTNTELPVNEIDGKNVWNLITGKPDAENPHEYYAFSNGNQFQGVMSADGKWKLHVPHDYRYLKAAGKDGQPGPYIKKEIDYALFDMVHDPYEKGNVIDEYPEIAKELMNYAKQHAAKFYE